MMMTVMIVVGPDVIAVAAAAAVVVVVGVLFLPIGIFLRCVRVVRFHHAHRIRCVSVYNMLEMNTNCVCVSV